MIQEETETVMSLCLGTSLPGSSWFYGLGPQFPHSYKMGNGRPAPKHGCWNSARNSTNISIILRKEAGPLHPKRLSPLVHPPGDLAGPHSVAVAAQPSPHRAGSGTPGTCEGGTLLGGSPRSPGSSWPSPSRNPRTLQAWGVGAAAAVTSALSCSAPPAGPWWAEGGGAAGNSRHPPLALRARTRHWRPATIRRCPLRPSSPAVSTRQALMGAHAETAPAAPGFSFYARPRRGIPWAPPAGPGGWGDARA